jgi:hypothetical protein
MNRDADRQCQKQIPKYQRQHCSRPHLQRDVRGSLEQLHHKRYENDGDEGGRPEAQW